MPVRLPFRPRRDAYPSDLWTKCPSCTEMLFNKQLDKTLRVCPHCGHHFRIPAKLRISQLIDSGSFVERDGNLAPVDSLNFVDLKPYPDRLIAAQLATGLRDAAVWGIGTMGGKPVSICVMDFGFIGGSMGAVVGEKVTRAGEAALEQRIPLIIVASSGGARMQEGTFALMQLVKTMGVVERVKAAGVPFISVMTDPTTGGVFASFAVVGDVNLTEPNALIRFAGDRVSSGTIGEELPSGYARAEFWLGHGFVDRIVARSHMRDEIISLLSYLVPQSVGGNADATALFVTKPRQLLNALTGALGGDTTPDNRSGEAPRG
jgi:acetyl-CoA carboxylase carboxyl transferase subunit beta